jgi:predicted MPP superfamily phosphohydrolase
MKLAFLPLLIIPVAIIFGAHFLIYKFIISFFAVNSFQIKKILIISLLVLCVSFIISSIISRYYENFFTKSFYFLSGFWYGWLINLLLATGLGWFLYYLLKAAGIEWNLKLFGIILYGLAFLITLYGVWNAQNFKLKYVDAPIKNLPANWAGRTAVQISDVHLGATYGVNYLNKIVGEINKVKPDIIFITGDFFDGSCPCIDEFLKPLENLKPPLGVYFITGNHEIYAGKDRIIDAVKNTKINLLLDKSILIDGLRITGLDYPGEGYKKDPTPIFKQIIKNEANILLYHQPTLTKQASDAGVNLQLSGHVHRGQLFPINFITKLIYGQYYYGYHNEGDYSIYTSSATGAWGPPVRTIGRQEIVVFKFHRE